MIVLRGENIRLPGPSVLAVGKFESIHMGHRALLGDVVRLAAPSFASALAAFEPNPYRVLFDPEYKPLFTGPEREHLARGLGLDYLLEYPFDHDFAAMSPEAFCRLLFEELQGRIIVVGEGYRFGHRREGTVDTLRKIAPEYHAHIHVVTPHANMSALCTSAKDTPPGSSSGEHNAPLPQPADKISTSTIRELLSANKLAEAERLLGCPFFVLGVVTPGRQLGRTIGFPTINLYPPEDKFLPANGVYATRTILDGRSYSSITNIGTRPTVETANAPISVETHLLDYIGGELYGKPVQVEFLRFIRPERRFESLETLKAQILEDISDFRIYDMQGVSKRNSTR